MKHDSWQSAPRHKAGTSSWHSHSETGTAIPLFDQSVRVPCTRKRERHMKKPLKKLPRLTSDAEAEAFVEKADLSQYDLSVMVPMRFEMKPKDASVNLRLPGSLLEEVRKRAKS